MGFIPDEIVEQVRAAADIVQIIGESVPLKRVGRRMVGLCPFHEDSQPSFYVNPDRGAFKCFGCGIGGDVFRFIMETERLTFPEAIRLMAERYGIEVPETAGSARPKGYRERLLTANEAALSFFRERLKHPEHGRVARDYLKKRQVAEEMIERFELGYAPEAWDQLAAHLRRKGVALEDAVAVGVIAPREKGDGYYDRFRHRVMCPVRNAVGQTVAFSGRLLGGEGPKYINSPESDVFHKSRTFYGLHLAGKEIGKRDAALVCEGNFDVISLHQFGFSVTVAALGTAFTADHATLLERYTKNATFVFDGDEAGQKAMVKLLDIYLEREEQPRVAVLPSGEDPDSFLKSQGAKSFAALMENAPSLLDFVVNRIFAATGKSGEGIARGLEEACRIAARMQSPIRRGLLANQLANRTNMPEEVVRQQIERLRRGQKARPMMRTQETARTLPAAERTILATLLHYPAAGREIDREALMLALPERAMRTLAERMLAAPAGEEIDAETLMRPDDDEDLRSLAGDLLMLTAPCEAKSAPQALADAIRDREVRGLKEELAAVSAQLAQVKPGDDKRAEKLERQRFALRKRLNEIR
ncbi:MAG TPA: DNA primase [bacterium]|nr:DNA primase [bacterium]